MFCVYDETYACTSKHKINVFMCACTIVFKQTCHTQGLCACTLEECLSVTCTVHIVVGFEKYQLEIFTL